MQTRRLPGRLTRRFAIGVAGAALAGCRTADAPIAGIVAIPERSLTYAPLVEAVRVGLYTDPPTRLTLAQRAGGRGVAALVADGDVLVGAMPLADLVGAAAEGAPLVAVGALTSRLACALVTAPDTALPEASLRAIVGGGWRALRVAVEQGSGGTEAFVRFAALSWGLRAGDDGSTLLAPDSLGRSPRWVAYETNEALVAALMDHRIEAFIGRPLAAAQAATLGGTIAANYATGEIAGDVSAALPAVLVARRDAIAHSTMGPLIETVVGACGRAATALSAEGGAAVIHRTLPERDALHLSAALRLAVPSPAMTSYAPDPRPPTGAMERYLELSAMAGRPLGLNAGALSAPRSNR